MVGKAGDQALRRSAFPEAISHLRKAIEWRTRRGAGKGCWVLWPVVSSCRWRMAMRCFTRAVMGAPETAEAFARARELAGRRQGRVRTAQKSIMPRAGNFARGELQSMRAHAAAFLRDVSERPDLPEAGVGHRCAGTTHLFAGEYQEGACVHWNRRSLCSSLAETTIWRTASSRTRALSAMLYLALVLWPMGDAGRAISLVRDAKARTATLTHIGVRAYGMCLAAMFELVCGNLSRAVPHAAELARLAHEHYLLMWRAYGIFLERVAKVPGWTLGRGLRDMSCGAELLRDRKSGPLMGSPRLLLPRPRPGPATSIAPLPSSTKRLRRASGPEIANRCRAASRPRRDVVKRDPASPATAEEALQTAIAVAKQQGTRRFELRAALSLAKLAGVSMTKARFSTCSCNDGAIKLQR